MSVTFDKFYSYLEDLLNSYTKLSALLRDKFEAADNFDILRLDEIIKEEQVYLLIARGFDKNIDNFSKDLALKGDTLSDAILGMPEEVKPRFEEIHKRLGEAVNGAKSMNDECQALLKDRLQGIERRLKELGKPASTASTYTNKKIPGPDGHSFSKSI